MVNQIFSIKSFFNIDVSHTVQVLHMKLIEHESEQTLQYLFPLNNQVPKSSLKIIGTRSQLYSGQVVVPTTEQSSVLGISENIEVFAHLLKYGVIYHSTSYERSSKGKRCNTYCRYQNVNGALCFGKLELFVKSPHAYAFIRQLEQLKT